MPRLANFNTLPPKEEHVTSVINVLAQCDLPMAQIQRRTGLTKTQAGCALDSLIASGKVEVLNKDKNYYRYIDA